jgi:hypothetical protein
MCCIVKPCGTWPNFTGAENYYEINRQAIIDMTLGNFEKSMNTTHLILRHFFK